MSVCDRCPGAGGCLLDYMGTACKNWRKKNAPEVLATMGDVARKADDDELARILCTAEFCGCCDYERENGMCRYIEDHPAGPLFDGCVNAAKRWLNQTAEKL